MELVQGPQSTFVFSDVGGHSLKGCHIPSSLCQSEGIKSQVAANVTGMARPPWTEVIMQSNRLSRGSCLKGWKFPMSFKNAHVTYVTHVNVANLHQQM